MIVCAGKDGRFSLEDAACAGLLAARVAEGGAELEGAAARMASRLAPREESAIRALVQGASHGRHLRSLGSEFARDVEQCSGLDTIDRAFAL